GEQPAILDRGLFEAVEAKLSEQANNHKTTRMKSEALLAGRIFDNRGNRMTPSHVRKRGIKYRYYLSSALLQGQPERVGAVSRIPAAEIEGLVVRSVRDHSPPLFSPQTPQTSPQTPQTEGVNRGEPFRGRHTTRKGNSEIIEHLYSSEIGVNILRNRRTTHGSGPRYPPTRYEPSPLVDLSTRSERERLSLCDFAQFFSCPRRPRRVPCAELRDRACRAAGRGVVCLSSSFGLPTV